MITATYLQILLPLLMVRRTMPARGRYSGGKKVQQQKKTRTHGHTHEPIHPLTHPPCTRTHHVCTTTVQEQYSSTTAEKREEAKKQRQGGDFNPRTARKKAKKKGKK